MFCNSTITDLFLFVFTQLILHYPNDNSLLISYLVVSDNNFSTDNLKKSLLKKLPNYMVPTIFEKINKLPLTKNGKFDILYLNENFRMDSLIKPYCWKIRLIIQN